MDIPTLDAIVIGLASGTATYGALLLLFDVAFPSWKISLSPVQKRIGAFLVAFLLAGTGLYLAHLWTLMPVGRNDIWQAFASAFLAAHALHTGEMLAKSRDE